MIDGIRGHELCEIMKYICKESKHVVERWWDCLKIWNPKLQCFFKMWLVRKGEQSISSTSQYTVDMEGGDFFCSHSSNGTLRNRLSGKFTITADTKKLYLYYEILRVVPHNVRWRKFHIIASLTLVQDPKAETCHSSDILAVFFMRQVSVELWGSSVGARRSSGVESVHTSARA